MEEGLLPAVTEVIQKEYPGSIVTHWSAAIAVVTPDGAEMVVMLDRPGQSIWQSLGLERFVSEMRKAAIHGSHHVSEDDDDY